MRNKIIFLFVFTLVLTSLSCRTRRGTEGGVNYKGLGKEEVLKKNDENKLDFTYLKLQGKADYSNLTKKENLGFSYQISIAKDSLILATITKMGLPAVQMLMDVDTVRIKMPLTKTAMVCDFRIISELVGMDIDFKTLQSYLTGDIEIPENTQMVVSGDNNIKFVGKKPPYLVSWFVNNRNFRLEKMEAEDTVLGQSSVLTYSDFQKFDKREFATSMNLEATQKENIRIDLKHSNIEFDDENTSFKFRIPSSYEMQDCDMRPKE